MPFAKLPFVAVALTLLLSAGLTACSSGASPSDDSKASASQPASSGGGAVDVCALVPTDALAAAIGADPGTGVAAKGKVDGGQCTWTVSSTHSALAQYTLKPDAYLPASIYPKPAGAEDIPGADRGWANAASHTVLVVKDGKGVLFTDIDFGTADQTKFTALGAAILGQL